MDVSRSPRSCGGTGHGVFIVRQHLIFATLILFVFASASQAGIFRRSAKPDPAVHVPALIQTLKTDTDERARAQAASALREYDAKTFPEILPTLIDALGGDKSPSVRAEAADSIGRIRPITAQAGYALEQARDNDKYLAVRISARTALFQYRILGYFTGVKDDVAMQTAEPPLAKATEVAGIPGSTVLRPTPSPVPVPGPVAPPNAVKPITPARPELTPKPTPETGEPPIADPSKPAPKLTSQPPGGTPVVTIPPPAPRSNTKPNLPAPKELPPGLDKPAPKPAKPIEDGPTLGPPPK